MSIKLRQSTASQELAIGPFLDITDGNTTEEALTIAAADIKLWKMGATALVAKNSGGATHMDDGVYYATLDATDTNTLGALVIFVHVADALAVRVECEVLAAAVYDAMIAASASFPAAVTSVAANALTASALAADAVTEIQSGLATAAALTTVEGKVDTVDTVVDAIKAKTDNLPTDPADQSLIIDATNTLATAIADLPTNSELATALASSDDAVMNRLGAPAGASIAADLAAVKADSAAILVDTGTDGVVVAAASKTGYRLTSAGIDDILRSALTEGYAADGATFTLEQGMYMLWSLMAERGIAGTTLTTRELDGSTTAMTFTLDDPDAPTTQTRTA
jgi:hypothetical protein